MTLNSCEQIVLALEVITYQRFGNSSLLSALIHKFDDVFLSGHRKISWSPKVWNLKWSKVPKVIQHETIH